MLRNFFILSLITALSSGCSFMFPYEKEFACKRGTNFGKCMSSMEAYEESTTGQSKHDYALPASKQKKKSKKKDDDQAVNHPAPNSGYNQYKDSEYKQISKILDKPITPILKKPEVLEILVLPYKTNNGTQLNGSRYVHIITQDSAFILGDVMTPKIKKVDGLFGK